MKSLNFYNINSVLSYNKFSDIRNFSLPEVCFAGRSNVGKSSLINAILNRKNIATTSNKPGHTKKIFFYEIDNSFALIDLPGYGYANVSKKKTKDLSSLILSYLKESQMLIKVFVLIDSRHGPKQNDIRFLNLLNDLDLEYQFIYTKIDKKIKNNNILKDNVLNEIKKTNPIIFSSTKTKEGVKQIKSTIIKNLFAENEKKV